MNAYPLTPQGAADRLADLYLQSDRDIAMNAIAIGLDFQSWVKTNFDVTTAQETYIDGMNADAVQFFGALCSTAFLFKIDIELVMPTPPTSPGYGKWTDVDTTIKMSTNGSGGKEQTGKLIFTIRYVL